MYENRHVGTELQTQPHQCALIEAAAPQAIERDQGGRRIRTAAAQPGAHRNALFQADIDAQRRVAGLLQQARRPYHQVVVGRDTLVLAAAGNLTIGAQVENTADRPGR